MASANTPSKQSPSFPLSRRIVIVFSLAAAALFFALSWLITVFFRGQSFLELFTSGKSLTEQLLLGLLLGIESAVWVSLIVGKARVFARFRDFLRGIIGSVRPTAFDIVLVATAAGLSEELFFRATLQPVLGLWLASLLFVLAHLGAGRLSPSKLAFGAFVFSMSALFGFTYEQLGLVAAVAAHASFDMVFLFLVRYLLRTDGANRAAEASGPVA